MIEFLLSAEIHRKLYNSMRKRVTRLDKTIGNLNGNCLEKGGLLNCKLYFHFNFPQYRRIPIYKQKG